MLLLSAPLLLLLGAPEQPAAPNPASPKTATSSSVGASSGAPVPSSKASSRKTEHAPRCTLIEAVIDEAGHIKEAHIQKPSRDPAFDQRALKQVMQWKYDPALYQGKPVPVFLSTSVCPHLAY